MSRPTSDPKEYVIKVRVNEDTRKAIERKARENDVPMSEIVRKAIENVVKQT